VLQSSASSGAKSKRLPFSHSTVDVQLNTASGGQETSAGYTYLTAIISTPWTGAASSVCTEGCPAEAASNPTALGGRRLQASKAEEQEVCCT